MPALCTDEEQGIVGVTHFREVLKFGQGFELEFLRGAQFQLYFPRGRPEPR